MSSRQPRLWTFPKIGFLLLLSHQLTGCAFYSDEPHYLGLEYKSPPDRVCPTVGIETIQWGFLRGSALCFSV